MLIFRYKNGRPRGLGPTRVIKSKNPKKSKLRPGKVIRKRSRDGQVQLPKKQKLQLESSDDDKEEIISTPKTSPVTDKSIDDEGWSSSDSSSIHSYGKMKMDATEDEDDATADGNDSETSDSSSNTNRLLNP